MVSHILQFLEDRMNEEDQTPVTRVTLKRTWPPNKMITKWLEELVCEATQKKAKYENNIREALNSVQKFPLEIESGAQCSILKGFDKNLCAFIDERFKIYNRGPKRQAPVPGQMNAPWLVVCGRTPTTVNSDIKFLTILILNASILFVFLKHAMSSSSYLTGPIVLKRARELVKKMIVCLKRYRYNWTKFRSSRILTFKGLLRVDDATNRFYVGGLGVSEARHLFKLMFRRKRADVATQCEQLVPLYTRENIAPASISSLPSVTSVSIDEPSTSTSTVNTHNSAGMLQERSPFIDLTKPIRDSGELKFHFSTGQEPLPEIYNPYQKYSEPPVVLQGGCFNIMLLVDKNESCLTTKGTEVDAILRTFPHEFRSLKVGDFTWIARDNFDPDRELVLPYIVERKRIDDLSASIKDGRFHEQKFRLRRCGIPNVIYMVENFKKTKHVGLPMQTLTQALQNTRVQDGFKVHMTDSLEHTVRFLKIMTEWIACEFQGRTLKGRPSAPEDAMLMTFEYFNKTSAKNRILTVTETFIKMLLQMKGLSVEKAVAITSIYKTPKSLIRAYEGLDRKEGEMLLSKLVFGKLNRKVGPAISKSVYQLFTSRTLK